MLFPVTTVCLIGCLVWAISRAGRRSALTLALFVWAFGLLLSSSPIFRYQVDYSATADVFVAACLLAVTCGYLVVRQRPRPAPRTYWNRRTEIFLAQLLGGLGIAGCVLLLLDATAHGTQLSVSFLLENLTAVREANFERLASLINATPMTIAGSYLAPCGLLSVIAVARLGRAGGRGLALVGMVNLILLAAVSLFVYGGRATLFIVLGLPFLSFYLSGRQLPKLSFKTVLMTIVMVVGIWYFSVPWLDTREEKIDPEPTLANTQRAEYRPWIASLARNDDAVALGLISLGYFASPLPTLAFYIEREPVPGPFWGGYSYPLPARTVTRLTGTYKPNQWNEIRSEVFAPLESAGYFGNVWATWLRDLLIDFGYVGALLYCGAFGAFMAWARNRFERTGALHYHYFEVLACFAFAFGAFTSLLSYQFLAIPFFLALGVIIAVRVDFGSTIRDSALARDDWGIGGGRSSPGTD